MKPEFVKLVLALAVGAGGVLPGRAAGATSANDLTSWVNPFIGTAPNPVLHEGYGWDTGNVFPGAVCPRGMVAWSPDTTHQHQIAGGYWYPDHVIEGFSLTHFSGRGVVCLRDIPFLPTVQPVDVSPGADWERFTATFSHTNETASPGYYRVRLDNGIEVELTATPRTGMARLTFPKKSSAALLIRADSSVCITNNEVTGCHTNHIGGARRLYTVYFAAKFDRPFQTARTWQGDALLSATKVDGNHCGAVLTFDTATNPVVQVRVGISYVSLENARANLAQENPGLNFPTVRRLATIMWNTELSRIQIEGGDDEAKRVFYTALYHCFLHPNLLDDANGAYPGMDGKVHYLPIGHHQYQNIPAWDQYRSLAPLIALLVPDETSDIVQSLVNYAQQDATVRTNGGGLPRWEQVNRNSGGMVGDGDDAIIASAYAFGANQFDTAGALAAMDKGASVPGTTSDGFEVRAGLADYLRLGYVPGQVSVTLEYCNDDFALAQFAQALGDRQKYLTYQNRAQNWKNLFDESTGLLRPKNADGSWLKDFSPATKQGFVEGTAAQYLWMVNFNLGELIEKLGGAQKAVARLNHFFTRLNGGVGADTAFMGNEPCEETPWVYDFAGDPAGTQRVVRRIQNELFTARPDGLPGNDDAGALSSWYVFSALGLYPEIPGVAGFVAGSPLFPKVTIHLENGATIRILGQDASPENCYVQSLKVNGRDWNRLWIPWSELAAGGTLDFHLGAAPSTWGTGPHAAPPSFGVVKPQ